MRRSSTHPLLLLTAFALLAASAACSGVSERPDAPRARALPPPQEEAPRFRHPRDVRRILISADGQRMATIDATTIALWSLPEMEPLHVAEDVPDIEFVNAARIAPDGRYVALLTPYQHLWLWDTEEEEVREVLVHYAFQPDLLIGFTPSGALLWRSNTSLVRWDPESDDIDVIGDPGYVVGSSGGPRHGYLLWASKPHTLVFDEGEVRLRPLARWWDYANHKVTPLLSPERDELFVFEHTEPRRLDLAKQQHTAFQTDAFRASLMGMTEQRRPRPVDAHISDEGDLVVVALTRSVEAWDARSGELLASFSPPPERVREIYPRSVYDIALGPDALYVLSPDQTLLRYDRETWALLDVFEL